MSTFFVFFFFKKSYPQYDAMTLNTRQGGLINFFLDSPSLRIVYFISLSFFTSKFNKSSSLMIWVKVWQPHMNEHITDSRKICRSDVKMKPSLPTHTSFPKTHSLVGWLEKMFIKRAQLMWQVPLLHASDKSNENRHIITWAFLVLKCYYCWY